MAIIYKPLPVNQVIILLVVRGAVRYGLFRDSVTTPGSIYFSMWKTVDYGDSWTELDAANRGVGISTFGRGGVSTADPDTVHVAFQTAGSPAPTFTGQSFDLVSETWDAGTWGGAVPYTNTGVDGGPNYATTTVNVGSLVFLPGSGIFSTYYSNGGLDHSFPLPGQGLLGRVNYATCAPGGGWSGGNTEDEPEVTQEVGFGVGGSIPVNFWGVGLTTHYQVVGAVNGIAGAVTDPLQACFGIAPGDPIYAGELRLRTNTGGTLNAGPGCFAPQFSFIYSAVPAMAGSDVVFTFQDPASPAVDIQVVADGVSPIPPVVPSNPDRLQFGCGQTGLGDGTGFVAYVWMQNNTTGDLVYQSNDGTGWTPEAPWDNVIPGMFSGLDFIEPVAYETGFIGAGFDSYFDKENTAAIDIIGGDPFGGPAVFPGGKVVLVGSPTGTPPQPTPGGWPVWPPHWQAENDYDRCLLVNKRAVRKFRWQDQTRCIVWHDMDELGRMPDGGLEFYERGSIITPAPAPVDTVVMEFTVPTGYLGIIYGVLFHYTGTGFEDGGGDIVWRMKVGNGWAAQGLGNCLFQLGTVGQCLSLTDYIAVNSNQRVQALVQVPNLSGNIQVGASRILATIQGWYYPL